MAEEVEIIEYEDVDVSRERLEDEEKEPDLEAYDLQTPLNQQAMGSMVWQLAQLGSPSVMLVVSPHKDVVKYTALLPFKPDEAESRLSALRDKSAPTSDSLVEGAKEVVQVTEATKDALYTKLSILLRSRKLFAQKTTFRTRGGPDGQASWVRWIMDVLGDDLPPTAPSSPFSFAADLDEDLTCQFMVYATDVPGASLKAGVYAFACNVYDDQEDF